MKLVVAVIISVLYQFILCEENVDDDFKSNRTGRNINTMYLSPDQALKKSFGFFKGNNDRIALNADNRIQAKKESGTAPKTPRGFADFISGDDNSNKAQSDEPKINWSPYYLPPLSDYMKDSGSSVEGSVWKRDDDSYGKQSLPSHYQDYADMFLMMQNMKKMDNSGNSKPGLLTRILDNPTTLVMATFIPMSLLLAAALPLLVNVMMNGITIPALIPSISGAKTRGFETENSTDILGSVFESLVDFSSRYMDNPDCFQKVFCETTVKSDKSTVPGGRYIKHAANVATLIVNEELLSSYGVKDLLKAIKKGTCEEVTCKKTDKDGSPSLLYVIKDAIHKHSYSSLPKTS